MDQKVFLTKGKVPVFGWTKHVPVDEGALEQLKNVADLPFLHKQVAVMPDVHWGMGATIGSVIATDKAVIPAAVGVDLGCGMMAQRTNIRAEHLPDNLHALRTRIECLVPHGRTNNGQSGDRGAWHDIPEDISGAFKGMSGRLDLITDKHPKLERAAKRSPHHLGTLGTGNHFVELCLDLEGYLWVMLHSGSRGIGNAIGTYFINKAKEDMRKWFVNLKDVNLAYLPEGTDNFNDYMEAVNWAQEFAVVNRRMMMASTLKALEEVFPELTLQESAINCHHNYVQQERHFGKNVYITRKGAVKAAYGDLGIIPGSMGAKSVIVRGLGNLDSFCSCSHGAGRVMSRTEARKQVSLEDHIKDTQGVECRKDEEVLDETPKAYKNIEDVMKSQEDLVEVVFELKQVVCVKG